MQLILPEFSPPDLQQARNVEKIPRNNMRQGTGNSGSQNLV